MMQIGVIAILPVLFSLFYFIGKDTDLFQRIKEGFTTRKEDLEVNWKEYYKHNK